MLILLSVVIYVGFIRKSANPIIPEDHTKQVNINADAKDVNNTNTKDKIDKKTENKQPEKILSKNNDFSQEDIKDLAESFAERFGSYSNQSNFSNITDLEFFMTKKMKSWAQDYVSKQRQKKIDTSIYYGITTKAVFSEFVQNDPEKAVLIISTRRREAIGDSNNSSAVFKQNIRVVVLKESGIWKVDSAYWEDN